MKYIFTCLLAACLYVASYGQQNAVGMSHYLLPEFSEGTVLMKDGRVNKASLNYNSLTEEMIFDKNGMNLAIGKQELGNIDTVQMGGRTFVVLNNKFVELVHQTDWALFAEHRCKVEAEGASTGYGGKSETTAARSVSTLQTQGRVLYDLELPDGYKTYPYVFYWLKINEQIIHFRNLKELKKLYADKKDVIKTYSKSHRVKYEDQQSIIQLIDFLESN